MRRALWLTTLLVGLILFGACGSDDANDQGGGTSGTSRDDVGDIQTVEIIANDYSFDAPATLQSGTTELRMKNEGKEGHIVVLAKIADGKTYDDVTEALSAPPGTAGGPPPFTEAAGIASTSPGLSSNETVTLEPGSYAFVCFLPAADGVPHFAKGMMRPFEVTDAGSAAAPLPDAVAEVTAKDFSYATDFAAKAGEQVLELTNDGTQPHEITLVEFAAGKGPADLEAFFAKPEGPPPATFLGGPVIAPGTSATWRTPALVAGKTYFFMCLIPDPADQVPHVAKGMALPVTVT